MNAAQTKMFDSLEKSGLHVGPTVQGGTGPENGWPVTHAHGLMTGAVGKALKLGVPKTPWSMVEENVRLAANPNHVQDLYSCPKDRMLLVLVSNTDDHQTYVHAFGYDNADDFDRGLDSQRVASEARYVTAAG